MKKNQEMDIYIATTSSKEFSETAILNPNFIFMLKNDDKNNEEAIKALVKEHNVIGFFEIDQLFKMIHMSISFVKLKSKELGTDTNYVEFMKILKFTIDSAVNEDPEKTLIPQTRSN